MLLDCEPVLICFGVGEERERGGGLRPEIALKLHIAKVFRSGQIDAKHQAYNAGDASSATH